MEYRKEEKKENIEARKDALEKSKYEIIEVINQRKELKSSLEHSDKSVLVIVRK